MNSRDSFAFKSLLTVITGLLIGLISPIFMAMEFVSASSPENLAFAVWLLISGVVFVGSSVLGFRLGKYTGRGILAFVWFGSGFLGTMIADSLDAKFDLPLIEAGNVGWMSFNAVIACLISAIIFSAGASSGRARTQSGFDRSPLPR